MRARKAVSALIGCAAAAALVAWQWPDHDADPPDLGWTDSGVPYLVAGSGGPTLHFQGQDADLHSMTEVESLGATRDSAFISYKAPGQSGTLVELTSTGKTKTVSESVHGIPLADVTGHVVVWAEETGGKRIRFVAYDTERGRRLATLENRAAANVVAVVDRSALLVGGHGTQWWDLDGEPAVIALPDRIPSDQLVMDADERGGYLLVTDEGTHIYDPDGRLRHAFGADLIGAFSPDGSAVALTGLNEPDGLPSKLVYDVQSDREISLRLPEDRHAYAFRWSPKGDLVVETFDAGELLAGDDLPITATYYVCALPSGECRRLGELPDSLAENFESSARGQIMATYVPGQ